MENITITITEDKIRAAMESAVAKVLKSDYGNPITAAIESAIKDKSGEIKKVVDQIIVDAINNTDFKTRIVDAVITRMVESALKPQR